MDISSTCNVIFVGSGAVGCFYASRLHDPGRGVFVSLVARSNYSAIADGGIRLSTRTFSDYIFKPAAVFPSVHAAAAENRQWHYVVVSTKALPDHSDETALIASLISPVTCIVLIQNGVGIEAPFRHRFPETPIVSAVTIISAEQTSPGVIRQNRWTRMSLGPYVDGKGRHNQDDLSCRAVRAAQHLCELWGPTRGGIPDIEYHDETDLQAIRWHKLCINAAMNPSAILSGGLGNADMVADPELREHLEGVMNEVWDAIPRVLQRERPAGLATPDHIIASTARNKGAKPSMLIDWESGRPLELEVLLGNPLRIARECGVDMPRTQSLYALLRSAQRQRERQPSPSQKDVAASKL